MNHLGYMGGDCCALLTAAKWTSAFNFHVASLLIAAGANVNQLNSYGCNALILFSQRHENLDYVFAQLLIVSGIDVNHIDNNGMSVLMWIVKENENFEVRNQQECLVRFYLKQALM